MILDYGIKLWYSTNAAALAGGKWFYPHVAVAFFCGKMRAMMRRRTR